MKAFCSSIEQAMGQQESSNSLGSARFCPFFNPAKLLIIRDIPFFCDCNHFEV